MAKDGKKRVRISLDAMTNFFGSNDVKEVEVPREQPIVAETKPVQAAPKPKKETLAGIEKNINSIYNKHVKVLPEESRQITAKDVKSWILTNPVLNVSSMEFRRWAVSPDGEHPNAYVAHFGTLLDDLGLEYHAEVTVKGYEYGFFIPTMSLYIDVDPNTLDTDDPKAKLALTINKNRLDIMSIWREIFDSREGRCKPFRFMVIKERLYAQGVREFLNEYVDWYYQKVSDEGAIK